MGNGTDPSPNSPERKGKAACESELSKAIFGRRGKIYPRIYRNSPGNVEKAGIVVDYQWLDVEQVLTYHDKIIESTGGFDGVRDIQLLESALGKPQNLAAYAEPTIYELAATYAEGIARNHPFLDGNKRTAFAAAGSFLYRHGFKISVEYDNEHVEALEQLAQGLLSREDFARHLETHSQPAGDPLQ
jgi:death-on-curing protein